MRIGYSDYSYSFVQMLPFDISLAVNNKYGHK